MNNKLINNLNRIVSYGIGMVLLFLSILYFKAWQILQIGDTALIAVVLFALGGALSFVPENKRTLLTIRDVLIIFASLIVNNVLLCLIICVTSMVRIFISDLTKKNQR